MEDLRESLFSDTLVSSAMRFGSSLAQMAPRTVKEAVSSFVDTVRWMLAEEPGEQACERTLDLEVIRALQEKYEASPASPHHPNSPSPRASSPRRFSNAHVRWSPICQTIYLDGAVENAPLRPCIEGKVPLSPLAF
eukprot:m.10727 g.10727  ORF g.10727 m.10727 type:complete len:136 (+) comp5662_c0_seq1:461-868(+)